MRRLELSEKRKVWNYLLPLTLGAVVVGLVYVLISYIPYLSPNPEADVLFGGINRCLKQHFGKEGPTDIRVSSTPLLAALAFSTTDVVLCVQKKEETVSQKWALREVIDATFDDSGAAWVVRRIENNSQNEILTLGRQGFVRMLETPAVRIFGIEDGILAIASKELVRITQDGTVTTVNGAELKLSNGDTTWLQQVSQLERSADKKSFYLRAGAQILLMNAESLRVTSSLAPCRVAQFLLVGPSHETLFILCQGQEPSAVGIAVNSTTVVPLAEPMGVRGSHQVGAVWYTQCDRYLCEVKMPSELKGAK